MIALHNFLCRLRLSIVMVNIVVYNSCSGINKMYRGSMELLFYILIGMI